MSHEELGSSYMVLPEESKVSNGIERVSIGGGEIVLGGSNELVLGDGEEDDVISSKVSSVISSKVSSGEKDEDDDDDVIISKVSSGEKDDKDKDDGDDEDVIISSKITHGTHGSGRKRKMDGEEVVDERFVTILTPKRSRAEVFLTPVKRTRRTVINGLKSGQIKVFDGTMAVKPEKSPYVSLVECFKRLERLETEGRLERRQSIDFIVRKHLEREKNK
ncbi:hypothetical protein NEHOM01_0041 [Nematocida homosporus]|uniref:uncharacterized protein n=1 Tax=Nematocida homosporus TaxID=1912981 RepID=UPI00221FD1F3|nr:uncharacterized protein NEHOM01_0041 [Nematocida homosporus]KAI5184296.1 hypothetical protein NEHOM01_0041 [Nematocida homosporus]